MDIEFREAPEEGEESNFVLAQAIHRKIGYTDPFLAFDTTLALVVPDMAQLGTNLSLDFVLTALSPETKNINLDVLVMPVKRVNDPAAGKLAFTPFGYRHVADMMSRRHLHEVLYKLARLDEEDHKQGTRRTSTRRDDVYNLMTDVGDAVKIGEKTEQGQAFKKTVHFLLVRELQRLLFDNRGPVDMKMQEVTRELHERLVHGDQIQKAVYEIIDHFGSIGELMREDPRRTVVQASMIRKARQDQWAQASRPKETAVPIVITSY